jgi:hypothetical protein
MLLGVNIDFWSDIQINKILGGHGQVIAWEEDPNHVARVLVKARVVSLEEIPWFIVSTEGPGFNGDSWTIQTEIIQANMLGGLAADEDFPPLEVQPELFQFFGIGQQAQDPFLPQQNLNQQQHEENVHGCQQGGSNHHIRQANAGPQGDWALWPPALDAAQVQQHPQVVLAPQAQQQPQQPLNFDLNEPLIDDDPGMVDNIFLVLGNAPQQQAQPLNEDVIIASSDSEGAVEEEPQVAQEAAFLMCKFLS